MSLFLGLSASFGMASGFASADEAKPADPWPLYRRANQLARAFLEGTATASELQALLDECKVAQPSEDSGWAKYKLASTLADQLEHPGAGSQEIELRLIALAASRDLEKWQNFAAEAAHLAELWLEQGQFDPGIDPLREALDKVEPRYEGVPVLSSLRTQMLTLQGDWDRALEQLQQLEVWLGDDPDHAETRALVPGKRGSVYLSMGLVDRAAKEFTEEQRRVQELIDQGVALAPQSWAAIAIRRADLRLATDSLTALQEETATFFAEQPDAAALPGVTPALWLRQAVALGHRESGHADSGEPKPAVSGEPKPAASGEPKPRRTRAEELLRQVLASEDATTTDRRSARMRLAHLLLNEHRPEAAHELLTQVRAASSNESGVLFSSPLENAYLTALECRHLRSIRADVADLLIKLTELEDAQRSLLEDWGRTEVRPGGLGLLQWPRPRFVLSELIQSAQVVRGPVAGASAGFGWLLQAQSLGSLARQLEAPKADVETLRKDLLRPGEGFLVYLPAVDGSHVFALDRKDLIHAPIARRDQLEERRVTFVGLVMQSPFGLDARGLANRKIDLEQHGGELAEILFPGAIRSKLEQWQQVTIVAHDLRYVPFEALPFGGSQLGLHKAVTYLPSLPLGLALIERWRVRQHRPEPDIDCVLMGATDIHQQVQQQYGPLPVLPWSQKTEERLLGRLRESRCRVLTGSDAHWPGLLATLKENASILHLLTHGVQSSDHELPAGLVLSPFGDDVGLVFAERIREIQAPPLTLLSACGTGRGPARLGDPGASDLSGVFFRSGSEVVVLPYAPLALDASIALAEAFHRGVTAGLDPAEALRKGRLAVTRNPAWTDPFYHSLLHVHGLGHYPVRPEGFSRQSRSWIAFGAGALGGAVASALLLWWRHRRRKQLSS